MRNKEGYIDSTAEKAINTRETPQRLKSIKAPPRKKRVNTNAEKKDIVYYSVPVYISK